MNIGELKAMMAELAPVIREYVDAAVKPVLQRVEQIDAQIKQMPQPKDGRDADLDDVRRLIEEEVKDIRAAFEAFEPPPPLPDISAMVAEALAAIPAPQDGKSVTLADVAPLIAAEIEKRVSELPKPKDGEPGRNGLDVKDLFRAEGGRLIAVLSDGTTKDLGLFVGKDGEDGEAGADGLGFDDLDVSYDGEKTITLKFTRGEVVKTFPIVMPVVIDRGVYRDNAEYKAGDGVTWAGSFWIAQKDTAAKPDASDDWRLSVKRGRDGKDGKPKDDGPPGPVRVGVPTGGN